MHPRRVRAHRQAGHEHDADAGGVHFEQDAIYGDAVATRAGCRFVYLDYRGNVVDDFAVADA